MSFRVDDAERGAIFRDYERSAAEPCNLLNLFADADGKSRALLFKEAMNCVGRAFANHACPARFTPDMRVCAVKGTNSACIGAEIAAAQVVLLLGQHDDGSAFGCFVGER